jgi:hypothetical protein
MNKDNKNENVDYTARSSFLDRTWIVNEDGEISSIECEDEGIVLYNFMSWNWDKLPKDISQKIVDVLNGL